MEPALEERGDLELRETTALSRRAAMEPALEERGDLLDQVVDARWLREPQWSPLSKSGVTVATSWADVPHDIAAMEPALEERGDPEPAAKR